MAKKGVLSWREQSCLQGCGSGFLLHLNQQKKPLKERLGAENGARTRDLNLGKVALYQLSYFRVVPKREDKGTKFFVFSKLFVKKMRPHSLRPLRLHFDGGVELLEETHVVLEVMTEVIDTPL